MRAGQSIMWTWFYKLASPPYVYGTAAALAPWFLGLAAIAIGMPGTGALVAAGPLGTVADSQHHDFNVRLTEEAQRPEE